MNLTLSQGVQLIVESGATPSPDDDAYVLLPIGPFVNVDTDQINRELAAHNLHLMDPEEADAEFISASVLKVWCYSTLAIDELVAA